MKLSSITLAAAIALAGSAAFADTTVNRTVQVGPNGEVTHVVKQTVNPDGSTRTVHRTRTVSNVTTPVVVHRKVVYHSPEWYRHHRHVAYVTPPHHRRDHVDYRHHNDKYAFTRHGEVHYANSTRPRHNNS
jgi:hypothetical protein